MGNHQIQKINMSDYVLQIEKSQYVFALSPYFFKGVVAAAQADGA